MATAARLASAAASGSGRSLASSIFLRSQHISRATGAPQRISAIKTLSTTHATNPHNNYDTSISTTTQRRSIHTTTPTTMPRKSGASAFSKPRPPTRKKLKKYHRRMRAQHHEKVGKHSAPGSKAAYRRQFVEKQWQTLLDRAEGKLPTGTVAELNAGVGAGGPLANSLGLDAAEYDYGNALLDDLMGNTAHLTSSSDPRPNYLGWQHDKFLKRIRAMMTGGSDTDGEGGNLLFQYGNSGGAGAGGGSANGNGAVTSYHRLPSDHDVSLLLRSYRDLHQQNNHTAARKSKTANKKLLGGKTPPIGLARALQHLFHEAHVPSSTFGQKTYTALLTCCATPAEARRVFQMMDQSNVGIDDVAWAVLVDVHARLGDYVGAASVMDEMSAQHGIVPPLTAYTSLLAGCYRVVNSGSMAPQHVKADAGKVAWDKWKELRVVGHVPDAMAYGAILRVLAAQGRPERAITVLEEMVAMEVKPTTLCFTSALRAVHRSHANALRFQGGYSKKNKRRERITAHHGRMARSIVIQAENSEVRQDDGFVSALMMCAATAGDTATAKAIYLANKVRRRKDLRSIGGPDHLKMLRGEASALDDENLMSGGESYQQINSGDDESVPTDEIQPPTSRVFIPTSGKFAQQSQAVAIPEPNHPPARQPTWQERVYGRDTRRLSALLHACSKAMEVNGLGNVWAGSTNLGYLDEWSLKAIETRPRPQYRDRSIPGMTTVDHLPPEMWEKDADKGVQTMSKRLRREKYRGIEAKEDELQRTMDELDSDLYEMLRDPNEPPAFDSGGTIGDMKHKEEQGLLPGGANYEVPVLAETPTEEEDEETISFMDAAEQTKGMFGVSASYDATTGGMTSVPAVDPNTLEEAGAEANELTDLNALLDDDDDDDEDIDVDLDKLQKDDPELYELLMSQEGAPSSEDEDEDISPEEEAAALKLLKHEDPELYKMLVATGEVNDVEPETSEVSCGPFCLYLNIYSPVFFARYQQR